MVVNEVNTQNYFLLGYILENLFKAEKRRHQVMIDKLHQSNKEAMQEVLDGFMYQGDFYKPSDMIGFNGGGKRLTLHLSLWPQMDSYLADVKQVELDRDLIKQVLFRLIDPYQNKQHIRNAIPDCIADCLPDEFRKMERMGGPDFKTLSDLRQYNKVLPKMEFYSTARMLY